MDLGRRIAARRRRGAGDRLRPREERRRRHLAGGRPSRFRRSADRAGSRSTSPRMSISRRWRARWRRWARTAYGPIEQSQFLRRLGIEARAGGSRPKPHARTRRNRRRVGAADRQRPHRHGRAVQGHGLRASETGGRPGFEDAAGLRRLNGLASRPMLQFIDRSMLQAATLSASPASATVSSPVPAACRRASMRRSMAASAPTMRPTKSRKIAHAWRRRSASRPDRLLTAYQIHSPDVVVADKAVDTENRPRADAIVTRTPQLAHRRFHRRLRTAAVC